MGVEGVLIAGVPAILNCVIVLLKDFALREIRLARNAKDELEKFHNTLELILAVLADAEKRQVKEDAVRICLERLKDVAYDAADVVDEISYEAMRQQERRDHWDKKVSDFLSMSSSKFSYEMAKKVKGINKRLDEITKDMSKFQLQTNTSSSTTTAVHGESSEQRNRQTFSYINESEIVGREDDKYEIMKKLTSVITPSPSSTCKNSHNLESVFVISIVGMGGLGKTSLAQLVYKDELVMKLFEPKIWVCVGDDFDVFRLLSNIMESITKKKAYDLSNLDALVHKVQELLIGKKYLLVLDDLWNEDAKHWERLKSLLAVGAQGSMILITTRKKQVADVVKGSIPPYNLKQLQEDECWSIIKKKAFSPGGATESSAMAKIGKEIAKKCGGLPLAAKSLGSLMHSKSEERDWLSIAANDIWNTPGSQSEIMPILKLSYDNLSSPLKQCFSYCSIFPKDWEINKETLFQLWMAEGFLEPSDAQDKRSVEDIGNEYFQNLVWSSFLEGVKKNALGDIKTCKMHDLVHDLAQAVAGADECVSLKVSELERVSKSRRLELTMNEELSATSPKTISNADKLRTIIVLEPNFSFNLDRFSSSKHLRVLHLGPPSGDFSKFLWSSDKLRHLRYFNLFSISFSEPTKNESISRLYNLQTLILNKCTHVHNLLKNMVSLRNLRNLDISFTDIVELPDSITSLCNLQRLDLNHCDGLTAFPESVTGLKQLRFLDMSFTPIEGLPDFVASLCHLQTLDVNSCKKLKALPEYVALLKNMHIFNFKGCQLLEELPNEFGALNQLRSLDLEGTAINVLPESCGNLHNLEYVNLFWCALPKEVMNWTKLRKFSYSNDGTPLGIGKLVCLQEFIYKVPKKVSDSPECYEGVEVLGNLNSLENLRIKNLQNVEDPKDGERANLKGKQNLRLLYLIWGEVEELGMSWDQKSCNFRVFEALQPPTNLRWLIISNFMGCDLSKWLCDPSCLPNLDSLEFDNCKSLEKLPSAMVHLPRLQYLRINDCRRLIEIPLFPSLTTVVFDQINYKLLVSSTGRSQTSLTSLFLHNVDEFIYFPLSILQNVCNLKLLQILGCKQFQGFRASDNDSVQVGHELGGSGSIQTLELVDCKVLKFLPDLRTWKSLRRLYISLCPQVQESLSYDLKSLSSLKELYVDFIQRDEQRGDPSVDCINLLN